MTFPSDGAAVGGETGRLPVGDVVSSSSGRLLAAGRYVHSRQIRMCQEMGPTRRLNMSSRKRMHWNMSFEDSLAILFGPVRRSRGGARRSWPRGWGLCASQLRSKMSAELWQRRLWPLGCRLPALGSLDCWLWRPDAAAVSIWRCRCRCCAASRAATELPHWASSACQGELKAVGRHDRVPCRAAEDPSLGLQRSVGRWRSPDDGVLSGRARSRVSQLRVTRCWNAGHGRVWWWTLNV